MYYIYVAHLSTPPIAPLQQLQITCIYLASHHSLTYVPHTGHFFFIMPFTSYDRGALVADVVVVVAGGGEDGVAAAVGATAEGDRRTVEGVLTVAEGVTGAGVVVVPTAEEGVTAVGAVGAGVTGAGVVPTEAEGAGDHTEVGAGAVMVARAVVGAAAATAARVVVPTVAGEGGTRVAEGVTQTGKRAEREVVARGLLSLLHLH